MTPMEFEHANETRGDVPVNNTNGMMLSKWRMDWRERLNILRYGTVTVMVKGDTFPPLLITGHNDFEIASFGNTEQEI